MPDFHLAVTQPFADYARGDRITDPAEVDAIALSHPQNVVRVAAVVADATPAPVAA